MDFENKEDEYVINIEIPVEPDKKVKKSEVVAIVKESETEIKINQTQIEEDASKEEAKFSNENDDEWGDLGNNNSCVIN